MTSESKRLACLWHLLLLAVGLVLVARAEAHGGGAPRLVDVEVGPYRLYVWSKPEPMRVGDAHLTIGVFEPARTGQADVPVLDATIKVLVMPINPLEEDTWFGLASREASTNPIYYEVDFALPAAGIWRTELTISGPAGSGSADFEMAVSASPVNWTLIGAAAAVLMTAGWWYWSGRDRPEAS